MSVAYRAVQWNRHKKVYGVILASAVAIYLLVFVAAGKASHAPPRGISDEILLIRALGTGALVLLHVVLCIGPLARLDRRFAPLLYNRRHMGVVMFLMALFHAALVVGYYGGFGERSAMLAVLDGYGSFAPGDWPFEWFGALALLILFLMAATSHDFWLVNLSPRVWKSLHVAVYGAYALVVMHVALGPMRGDRGVVMPTLIGAGIVLLTVLHVAAARKERSRSREADPGADWIDAGRLDEIPESRAKVVRIKGRERVAVFRRGGTVSAVSNVCAHQGGPLGEGKIVDGCITCPWHGYQYRAEDGCSPPPFTEKIPTYQVRIVSGRVLLNPRALPPGTRVEPALISRDDGGGAP